MEVLKLQIVCKKQLLKARQTAIYRLWEPTYLQTYTHTHFVSRPAQALIFNDGGAVTTRDCFREACPEGMLSLHVRLPLSQSYVPLLSIVQRRSVATKASLVELWSPPSPG